PRLGVHYPTGGIFLSSRQTYRCSAVRRAVRRASMSSETAPKWTIQTGDGALLPEDLRAFVDAWLEEAGGDPLRALVFAAQDAATLERAASHGLCRGASW